MNNEMLNKKIGEFCDKICNKVKYDYCNNHCPFTDYCGNGKNGFEEFLKGDNDDDEL